MKIDQLRIAFVNINHLKADRLKLVRRWTGAPPFVATLISACRASRYNRLTRTPIIPRRLTLLKVTLLKAMIFCSCPVAGIIRSRRGRHWLMREIMTMAIITRVR